MVVACTYVIIGNFKSITTKIKSLKMTKIKRAKTSSNILTRSKCYNKSDNKNGFNSKLSLCDLPNELLSLIIEESPELITASKRMYNIGFRRLYEVIKAFKINSNGTVYTPYRSLSYKLLNELFLRFQHYRNDRRIKNVVKEIDVNITHVTNKSSHSRCIQLVERILRSFSFFKNLEKLNVILKSLDYIYFLHILPNLHTMIIEINSNCNSSDCIFIDDLRTRLPSLTRLFLYFPNDANRDGNYESFKTFYQSSSLTQLTIVSNIYSQQSSPGKVIIFEITSYGCQTVKYNINSEDLINRLDYISENFGLRCKCALNQLENHLKSYKSFDKRKPKREVN